MVFNIMGIRQKATHQSQNNVSVDNKIGHLKESIKRASFQLNHHHLKNYHLCTPMQK